MSALDELTTLLITCPPPFVYIHDPFRNTAPSLIAQLNVLHAKSPLGIAVIDSIIAFTPRLIFDSALNQLAEWTPEWSAGCANWSGTDGGGGGRWNDNIDGFTHGLRAVMKEMEKKGKNRIVLVFKNMDQGTESTWTAAFTRLHELAQIPITTVFIGAVSWFDLRGQMDGCADPYYLALEPPSEAAAMHILHTNFLKLCETESHPAYSSSFLPLYKNFTQMLYQLLSAYTIDPVELAYVSAARWPGFVAPVLGEKGRATKSAALTDEKRMRLVRDYRSSVHDAVEQLYPRRMNATQWAKAQERKEGRGKVNGVDADPSEMVEIPKLANNLTVLAKYVLVGAFLASVNPAKSDVQVFMRSGDGPSRKRRGGKISAKASSRHLGPLSFPLDRLLAIIGSLIAEHDPGSENRQPLPHLANDGEGLADERAEIDVQSVAIFSEIQELISLRLLHRISRPETVELGGHVVLKSAVPEEQIRIIAPDILQSQSLDDLIWNPTQYA